MSSYQPSSQSSQQRQEQVNRLIKNYKFYQDKLLQVTQKNRSVLLKKIYHKHNFDLTELEQFKEGIVEKIISKTIKNIEAALNNRADEGASQNILLESIDSEEADSTRSKLRMLSKNLNQIEVETGQQTGYVGFPFLLGHSNSDFYLRGPIVLFPLSLEQRRQAKNGGWYIHLADKRPILNGALIASIKKKGGYQLPEDYERTFDELIEEMASLTGDNLDEQFFDGISEWIKNLVPIDESKNQIQTKPLEPLNKDSIEKLEKQQFHLVNYKIIGNFPQAENEIFKDYNDLIKKADNLDIGIIGELLEVDTSEEVTFIDNTDEEIIQLDEIKDRNLNTVLESDSSQEQVILESKQSELVAVRGPPGTGKSQVIVNLISDALTNRKKVLLVCQKRAALDVVYQRLGKVDLDRYVVFLGKENDDRLRMYHQLNAIIEEDPLALSLGEISVEEISTRIDRRVQFLSMLGSALRKPYFGGVTAHNLYCKANGQYKPVLDLRNISFHVEWNSFEEYLEKIKSIENAFKKYEDENYPLFGRKDFSKHGLREKGILRDCLSKLSGLIDESLLARGPKLQSQLLSHFDTYLNHPGFLKLKQKKAAKETSKILGIAKISDNFVSTNLDKVKNGIEWWKTFSDLIIFFNEQRQRYLVSLTSDPRAMKSFLGDMIDSLSEFDPIQEYDKKKNEFDTGILELLHACKGKMNLDDNWSQNIEQEIYAHWIDKIEEENQILKGEPFENYELNKKELGQLMEEKKKVVRKKIQYDIENTINIRDLYKRKRSADEESWKSLNKELKKKRRLKPVRKLLEDYRANLLEIAPCWLASPESVSKVFPLQRNLFDLIIVDEASQLAIERALPFLYRGKHIVIAGDEKQLPPFDLFQLREEELDDLEDEEISDEKSLLDLARTRYRTNYLSWHYRSKYQDLINFSNHAFYEGLLNVAPNVKVDPAQPPIRWISCNGVWDHQRNHVEASRVIDEVKNIWEKHSESGKYPSIGIITFNEKQKEIIDEMLDKRNDTDPEFYELYSTAQEGKKVDDRIFVKNIENVQGDERDIIIFSIGYAKDSDGKFANRFGTLSHKGGENRLNVAITRAREEMVVVCSIEPSEIKETSLNDGPKRLRQFLEYSKATSALNHDAVSEVLTRINVDMERSRESRKEFDSEFEILVAKALEDRGYKVDTQVGQSGYKIDLAIVHPHDENRYVLAIECDGATFHSAKSVKERDVMRQEFLEGKGWKIERIWSRNWWKNPNREIDRLDAKIKERIQHEVISKS